MSIGKLVTQHLAQKPGAQIRRKLGMTADQPWPDGRTRDGKFNLAILVRRCQRVGVVLPKDALLAIINDPDSTKQEIIDAAAKAAPYFHPRLIAAIVEDRTNGQLTHDQWVMEILADDAPAPKLIEADPGPSHADDATVEGDADD